MKEILYEEKMQNIEYGYGIWKRNKALEKYDENLVNNCGFSIFISDKGNLVFKNIKLVARANKETVNEQLEQYKRIVEGLTPIKRRNFNYKLNYLSSYTASCESKCEDVIIKVIKYIFTPNGIAYYVNGKKIKRFPNNTFLKVFYEVLCKFYCPKSVLKKIILNYVPNNEIIDILKEYLKYHKLNADEILIILGISRDTKLKNISKYERNKLLNSESFANTLQILNYIEKTKITDANVKNVLLKCINSMTCFENGYYSSKKYLENLRLFHSNDNGNADMIFANRLKNDYYIRDTFFMYNTHLRYQKKNPSIPPFDSKIYKLNFKELHDELSVIIKNDVAILERRNYEYSKLSLNLQKECEEYKFVLPKNNIELTRIATLCNNCVAGYNRRINNSCIIVFGYKDKQVYDYIIGEKEYSKNLQKTEPLCIELTIPTDNPTKDKFYSKDVHRYGYSGKASNVVAQCYTVNNKYPSLETAKICNQYFDSIGYHHIDYTKRSENNIAII